MGPHHWHMEERRASSVERRASSVERRASSVERREALPPSPVTGNQARVSHAPLS